MTQLHALKSWYDSEKGSMITLEDDVLGIVSRVREITDGKVKIEIDDRTGWYHLVEHAEDGSMKLVFSVEELDGRVVERLMRADSQSRGYEDPYLAAEREQDALDKATEYAQREKINEMGEELIFEIQKSGNAPFLTKGIYVPRDLDASA